MAQLTDDCFAFGGPLLPLDEALTLLSERVRTVVGVETVALKDARARILAEDVVSRLDVPPLDNAAVDGYAVRFDDLPAEGSVRMQVAGRAAAGHPAAVTAKPGKAVRIFTGAPVPPGFDTVLMQEDCTEADGAVTLPSGIKRGANYRRAGEDIRAGTTVLTAGRRLRPQDVGLAAAAGHGTLAVCQPLRAAVFSTGDELHDPGGEIPAGGICDSNRHGLIGLLVDLGCAVDDLGILNDRYDVIHGALAAAAKRHDLIVTSGGMSVGDEDHVKAAVEASGALHFWQLAIKPGRPIGFGHVRGTPFIGLPGNPVGMMVSFLRIARPVILGLAGCTETEPTFYRVPVDFSYKKKRGRREWVRARLVRDDSGTMVARKFPREGSGILSSMVESHGLCELPEAVTALAPGDLVDFLPYTEVSR